MITANLNKLELAEFTAKNDPKQHCTVTFPLLGVHGTKNTAMVYFELALGDHLGRHTDSAEEILIVLEGKVTATIGDENAILEKGNVAVVPKMEPHDVKNAGNTTAKVLGVFGGANNIVSTFDHVWMPDGSNTVDTAAMTGPSAC